MRTGIYRIALAFCGMAAALAGCAPQMPDAANAAPKPAKKANTAQKETKTMSQLPRTPLEIPAGKEIATFAGGCFWCVEAIFTDLKGVEKAVSGYSGGQTVNPSYEQVCSGATGHAEAIQITFDPKAISYRDLVRIFLTTHDPTTLNRQGADAGTQYRSAIFFHSDAQQQAAREVIQEITKEKVWPNPIVTEVTAFANFYHAEEYHQDYYANNAYKPYCQVVIAPKVAKFREKYRAKLAR